MFRFEMSRAGSVTEKERERGEGRKQSRTGGASSKSGQRRFHIFSLSSGYRSREEAI